MTIDEAQQELRKAYLGGAPGVLISGLAWLAAGLTQLYVGFQPSIAVLFVGGMLIFPLSIALSRLARAPAPTKHNPLMSLGFESTIVLFAGLFAGFSMLFVAPALAFAMVAIVTGARYFIFSTLYGQRLYWLLGAVLMGLGAANAMMSGNLPIALPIAFGVAELCFAPVLYLRRN